MKKTTLVTLITTLLLSSCFNSKNENRLNSDELETKTERIETLNKEIKSKSEFDDAEFELFNVNGFTTSRITIPGASSLDYKFVIKLNPSDIDKWTEGMLKFQPTKNTLNWTKELIEKRKNIWATKSLPEFYSREEGDVIIIVYPTEGILFKRIIKN